MQMIRKYSISFSFFLAVIFSFVTISQTVQGQSGDKSTSHLSSFRGKAPDSQIIQDGAARYTILSPYLIRLEYSEKQNFEDRPTFHVINRNFSSPSFKTRVENGWRIIRTKAMEFRYDIDAGPFSVENTRVTVSLNGEPLKAQPRWNRYHCRFGNVCEAETARLFNPETKTSTYIRGDWISNQHLNYTGTGYVSAFNRPGTSVQWELDRIPNTDTYHLNFRYATPEPVGDILLKVDGSVQDTITFSTTVSRSNWETKTIPIELEADSAKITLQRTATESSSLQLDHLSVNPLSETPPTAQPVTYDGNLGGWDRGLGNIKGEIPLHDGIISKEGWYLLDDTRTPIWTSSSTWVTPRNTQETYQDTYLFGYGHHYKKALQNFADLTGHPPLLPRWAFGIMFSRNHPYGAKDFTDRIVPNQHKNDIPLDGLIIDTDFKSPDQWNGWNWDSELFPHPDKFLEWTDQKGLKVALNIHPSINHEDPQFPLADSLAGGLIDARGECPRWQGMQEPCSVWNWGIKKHARSYFALHERFEAQGVDFWWLDWCCDGSRVTMKGLTPDAWINQQYTLHMESQKKRGFSLSRIGSKWQNQSTTHPGPWAEHRNTIHFTGDTYPTWDMLKFQSFFTTAEGNIGMPYVSHDIGSYHAGGPRADEISDQMYIRWVQFGTFQPIFRSHGHGKRLPWQFEGAAREVGTEFMRLRQKLIPYLYTEARRAHQTGLPIARSMYLRHPNRQEAYQFRHQYYFGTELLVAPVAQPGTTVTREVWLPQEKTWYHFFTGKTYKGNQSLNIKAPLENIPVLAPAGAIIPMGPNMDFVGQKPVDPLTLKIFSGADGKYTLYEDRGSGLKFRDGAYLKTPITYSAQDSTNNVSNIRIGTPKGKGYKGQTERRGYTIELYGVDRPARIKLNGKNLQKVTENGMGWRYQEQNNKLYIQIEKTERKVKQHIKIQHTN